MGKRLAAGVVVLAAVVCGCGSVSGPSRDPDLADLRDGRASGPGFEFKLPDRYRALKESALSGEKGAARFIEDDALASGVEGLLVAGFWVDPSVEGQQKPSVNVVIEPITRDTTTEDLLDGTVETLRTTLPDARRVEPTPTTFEGRPARLVLPAPQRSRPQQAR